MPDGQAVDWTNALLKQNPFSEIPPRKSEDAVWAGMPRLRDQFDALFTEALTTSAMQVVLNWGPYGSGKTHAAIYFGTNDRLPRVEGIQVKDTWILCVNTPRDPSQADVILYRNILEAIRFSRLRQVIRDIVAEYGESDALGMLQDVVGSEVLGKALLLLGLERSSSGQLSLFGDDDVSAEWQRLLQAYFFSQHTKSDLRQLGLSRGIDSSQDRFRILGGVLQCLIGLASAQEIGRHSRVLLWIDEMEDLIYFTSRQYRPFTQGLRDLIDRLPNFFTLFMNFTLAAPEAYEDATVVLGQALMDRVTRQIYFQEPNEQAAFEYVSDLLRIFRTEDPAERGLPPSYPFTEDTLHMVIDQLPSRTPRVLNKRCAEIVSEALQRGIVSGVGEGIISRDLVAELDRERVELELE
jgi:hypothetical protein